MIMMNISIETDHISTLQPQAATIPDCDHLTFVILETWMMIVIKMMGSKSQVLSKLYRFMRNNKVLERKGEPLNFTTCKVKTGFM